jgi:uncharacterized protein YndB with AHSA1/START domain
MITTLIAAAALAADAPPTLRPGLEPLGFLVGHCWRGRFASGEVDTHCFETAYDGQHVRDRHEVTGGRGLYRGETLYSADGSGAVSYTYWNSLGGVSRGTMRPDGPVRLDFGDERYRGPDGREASIGTAWRRVGDDAYEAVTSSTEMPSMNRTVRYERVAAAVEASTSQGPDGSHALVHETVVSATAAQVWQAISTADGWRGWAVPVAWLEGDLLETSYTPTAARGDPSTIQQRIVATIPGRMFVFRTIKAPQGFPNFDTFRAVTHVLEIEPVEEGRTRVRLTSAGYADTEAGRQLLGFFNEGNRITLERLRDRFVSGPVDWSRARSAAN